MSQISAPASGAWRHPYTLVSIRIWDFYFDISEWHILSARAWTPALMLHLTNPCTQRKVLRLTKPIGKIYKTKSLGNYITQILLYNCQNSTSVICLHIVCFTWPIDLTPFSATTSGQTGSRNNGNEGLFHLPQSSKTGASL